MTNTLTLNVKQIIFNNALFDNDIYLQKIMILLGRLHN